jgi:hypothetical protein
MSDVECTSKQSSRRVDNKHLARVSQTHTLVLSLVRDCRKTVCSAKVAVPSRESARAGQAWEGQSGRFTNRPLRRCGVKKQRWEPGYVVGAVREPPVTGHHNTEQATGGSRASATVRLNLRPCRSVFRQSLVRERASIRSSAAIRSIVFQAAEFFDRGMAQDHADFIKKAPLLSPLPDQGEG